jgi:hypothetical protein
VDGPAEIFKKTYLVSGYNGNRWDLTWPRLMESSSEAGRSGTLCQWWNKKQRCKQMEREWGVGRGARMRGQERGIVGQEGVGIE